MHGIIFLPPIIFGLKGDIKRSNALSLSRALRQAPELPISPLLRSISHCVQRMRIVMIAGIQNFPSSVPHHDKAPPLKITCQLIAFRYFHNQLIHLISPRVTLSSDEESHFGLNNEL
ncbi:hypothetical protein AVEN_5470-1 [Araneus ventricosus]|uniref:Uncharacterized protein n=1 Tax=Araneus ventricosus TaxID=182803 RepID=A0A4Y2DZG3_ARAVE|nr:hypothetical protein AVEN_5470-1 [Araneus ventricosus]